MNQSMPSNHLSLSRPGARQQHQTQVDSLQQRVAFLEKELVDTRLQLACSKSSEDSLKMELSKMSSAFAKFAGDSRGGDCDGWLSGPSCSMLLSGEAQAGDENMQENSQQTKPRIVSVPTANPSLLRGKATVRRARRKSIKVLNPGSCSSGLDLLALTGLGSTNSGSLASLARPRRDSLASLARPRRANLNPGSCASGMDFGNYVLAGLNGNDESRLSLQSMASAAGLIISTNSKSNTSRRGSNASVVSALGTSGVSTTNITAMLGNARLLSASSFYRPQGSRSNVRNARISRSMNQGNNVNGNAEWSVFE